MYDGRKLNADETKYILSIKEADITDNLLLQLFARKSLTVPPMFDTNDYFILPKNECCENTMEGYTTIGRYIYNRFIIEPHFTKLIGYINKPIDGKLMKKVENVIANALYTDKITTDIYEDYLNRIQWLSGNKICTVITPSLTPGILKPVPGLNELKEKLKEENKEAIKAGDAITGRKIEQKLVKYAAEKLKDDPGMENFNSHAKADLDNNYKTMNIMKGPLRNNSTGKYQINFSNYNEGVKKEEYASIADSAVLGAYSRSTQVAVGGYLARRSLQTLNTCEAGPKDSDCGTDEYLEIKLDSFFKPEYLYRYIIENGKLVLLTEDNFDKYANKIVKLRSPMFCHMKEPYYCNKCVGEQPYMLNLTKFGLAISRASNTLLNLNLKLSHNVLVKYSTINPDEVLHFIK